MRILMLNNEFPPIGGGQGVVNLTLLEYFSRIPELSIDLITANRSKSEYRHDQFSERIRIFSVPVKNRNLHHSTGIELIRYFWRGYAKALKLIRTEPPYDLTIAFSTVPAGFIAWMLARQKGIPYLVRSPGVDIPGFEERYRFLYPLLAPFIRLTWGDARTVIVSSAMHERLVRSADPSAPTTVIFNAVDTELFNPGPPRHTEHLSVVCVARLVKRKGVDLLVDAVKILLDRQPYLRERLMVTLVGTGDDEDALRQTVREQNLSKVVQFMGAVPREEMAAVYQSADLFVLPSFNEGMSNAALEALASGLPLILTDVGGTEELVHDGVNGYRIPPGDVRALAQRLERLLTDDTERAEMAVESRRLSGEFAWAAIAGQYFRCITGKSL